MANNILDLFRTMSGQPDINQQIANALGQAPGQPGSSAPAPVGPAAPAAGPQAGDGAAPAAPPQPQAYQSSPDMTQLYLKFAQQQHADDMFNRGLAGIAAGFAPSWDRSMILGMGQGTSQDPGALFGNLVKLQQYQQQQQQLQNYRQAVPAFVKAAGLDESYIPLMQSNPELGQSIIQGHQPEGTFKNWQLAHDSAVNKACPTGDAACVAKADADFQASNPLVNALTPGGGDPQLNALHLRAIDWQRRNPGEPLPDYFNNGTEGLAAHDAQVTSLSASQAEAGKSFPTLNDNLKDMQQKAQDIVSAKNLSSVLSLTPPQLAAARRFGYVATALPSEFGGISQADLDLLKKIDELQSWNTGALKQANPHLTSGISRIETGIGGLTNFNVGPDLYAKNIQNGLINPIEETRAQGIGAAGRNDVALDEADKGNPNMLIKMDPSYVAAGKNFLGDAKPVPPAELAKAKAAIAQGAPRDLVVKALKAQGWMPKPGEI
jgi:hypothetical protein